MLLTLTARVYFGVVTSDDAFITYRYARQFVATHSLVYNPGEHIFGTSTPLYVLIMTVVTALRLPVEATSVAIGAASDVAMVVTLFRLLAAAGFSRSAPLGAALAGALPLSVNSTSTGMETPLYTLLILLMFRHAAAALDTGRTAAAAALVVAVGLCRPDGAFAVAVALAGVWVARPRTAWRMAWPAALAALVVGAAAWSYYGTVVPQSVMAKAAGDRSTWGGVKVLGEMLLLRSHVVPTILAVGGAVALWRRGIVWRWLIVWWLAYASAFALTGAFLRGDWYFVPLQPLYWGCAAAGLELALSRSLREPRARAAFAVAALVMVAMCVRGWSVHRAAFAAVHATREEPYLAAGRQIAASDRPCRLAAPEIGAVGYAFPGRIIDLGGLVTPSAVRRPAARVIQEQDAQWLVTLNIYMPEGVLTDPVFSSSFERVQSVPLVPGRTLEVYKRRHGGCRGN